MKGIIFTVLNELVEDKFGLLTWENMLDKTGDDGIFAAPDTYEDERLFALVGVLAGESGLPAEALLRAYGEYAVPKFAEFYPVFFEQAGSLREFLLSVDSIIHVEVQKLYPEARLPRIWYDGTDDETVVMNYQSDRKLCVLAEGLVTGAAAYYGSSVTIEQAQCQHRGDGHCEIRVAIEAVTEDAVSETPVTVAGA